MELVFCSRNNNFQCLGQYDPDLWSYDPKINRGNVLHMADHRIKYTAVGWLILKLLSENRFQF
jgi:hypothetical protein